MKYIVKDIISYVLAIKTAWALAAKKGEKEVRLNLTGNILTATAMGGGAILHSSIEVEGVLDGTVWVDGAQLVKVSSLVPVGRELTVTLGQALMYQVQGYASQDIVLCASHPTLPNDMGVKTQLFSGASVDLTSLNCEDGKALSTLSLQDYGVVLNSNISGAVIRTIIPTAYTCALPVFTEVSVHILTIMKKMKEAVLYHHGKSYLGLVDGCVELLVPLTDFAKNDVVDTISALPSVYTLRVQQSDFLSALNWSALSTPTSVTLSYNDPFPYIELTVTGTTSPTKIAMTQQESEDMEDAILTMGDNKYAPTTLLSALSALPKGLITLTGKSFPATDNEKAMDMLLLSSHSDSGTTDVLVSALA